MPRAAITVAIDRRTLARKSSRSPVRRAASSRSPRTSARYAASPTRADGPEVVPVRVDGVGEVALVARRLRQRGRGSARFSAVSHSGPRRVALRCSRCSTARCTFGQSASRKRAVAGEAEALGHCEHELAVAVVLDEPVRSVLVDGARHRRRRQPGSPHTSVRTRRASSGHPTRRSAAAMIAPSRIQARV